ncbi:peptidase M16 domain-containing protein [Actinoplanes sp. SE50]|uniref:peptidase M16 n=1 Tax=unclassified Actinoplanes TaxID=2626549 RepID=UPI00023EC12C|nr:MULTISPECIES: peptidase M16 [unclassified Actinoplanes]AEV85792.1 peptidase M16 domain protein [Actinoplanes sp. SE50/110]ATO84186.1 peptidase M16 domain-containing protein [Actinoplanes sp. SE50]SLM01596.1 peptidase M16 domain-containing protein [Actinoplanes sp. SE50/110]
MSIQFETGGVPGVFVASAGPLRAGLIFRVGEVDEPLARRGVTRLIEHLVRHAVTDADQDDATAPDLTEFHTEGSAEQVRAFLAGVCAALRELPADRLAVARDLVHAEYAARHDGAAAAMPIWRHGAHGYGLTAYPRFGLDGLQAEDLKIWTNDYFVRGNAALWVSGPHLPADLGVDLPAGDRRPAPATPTLPATPGYFPGPDGVIVWDAVVPRETAAVVFTQLLARALHRTLRVDGGLSYTATAGYAPRADGTALITALADGLPEKQDAVLAGLLGVLDRLRHGDIDEAELATVVTLCADGLTQAAGQGAGARSQAIDLLLGRPPAEPNELLSETRAVTRADVTRVARAAFAAGLLQKPGRPDTGPPGWTPAPVASTAPIDGDVFPSLADPARTRVIIGAEGASMVLGETAATVRFDACAAVLAWPDGARRLIGDDGVTVHLEPTMFHRLAAAIPTLDGRVPAGLRAAMAVRDPAAVPQPQLRLPTITAPAPPAGAFTGPPPSRWTWRGYLVNLVLCVGVIAGFATGALDPAQVRAPSGSHPLDNLPAVLIVVAMVGARAVWAARGLLRLYRH